MSVLDLDELPHRSKLISPSRIRSVPTENLLDLGSSSPAYGFKVRYGPATTNDRKALASMLDRIQQVSKVSSRLRCAYFSHKIRLSDPARWGAGGQHHSQAGGQHPSRTGVSFRTLAS